MRGRWRKNKCFVQPGERHSEKERSIWCKTAYVSLVLVNLGIQLDMGSEFHLTILFCSCFCVLVTFSEPPLRLKQNGRHTHLVQKRVTLSSVVRLNPISSSNHAKKLTLRSFLTFWNPSTHPHLHSRGSQPRNRKILSKSRWLWAGRKHNLLG